MARVPINLGRYLVTFIFRKERKQFVEGLPPLFIWLEIPVVSGVLSLFSELEEISETGK